MYFISSEKLLVLLRDGRKLLGLLRSFDQFGNVSIQTPYFALIPLLFSWSPYKLCTDRSFLSFAQLMLFSKVHVNELLLVIFIVTFR